MSVKVSATRDGEPSRVAKLFCQVELQERETVRPADAESAQTVKGTKVLWELFPGHHIPGTIERDNGDGTYDIAWTYGGWFRHEEREPHRGKRVEKGRIQPAPDTSEWLKKLDAGVKDLRGADFRFTDLTGIDFIGRDLRNAKFDGSKIVNCSFGIWDPVTGKYDGTRKGSLPELEGATFWCATLEDVDFTETELKGIKFGDYLCGGAILIRVSFWDAHVT